MEKVAAIPVEQVSDEVKASVRSVKLRYLINKLNFLNFNDGSISLLFRHAIFSTNNLLIQAIPAPCIDENFSCRITSGQTAHFTSNYKFESLLVPDDNATLKVNAEIMGIDGDNVIFRLPASCEQVELRKHKRLPAQDIAVKFIQRGSVFTGTLIDFSAASFRVHITPSPEQRLSWIEVPSIATIILSRGSHIVFSGDCHVTATRRGTFLLSPTAENVRKFPAKKFRSNRYLLQPSPNIRFTHPVTGRECSLKIIDVSGTGFQTEDALGESTLIAGLTLPEAWIDFSSHVSLKCTCQVIYRRYDETGVNRYGLTILDMNPADHVDLLGVLHQANDRNTYVNNRVDMKQLWNFFFETGFIYPEKYAAVSEKKDSYKEMYEKLYNRKPDIARHFISQEKGTIHGHLSTIRYYPKTWLIHHHAANKNLSNHAGLDVLHQIHNFLNDSHRIHSCNVDYVICYYRPDNKFPDRVFGGAARNLGNPKWCSMDAFAYFYLDTTSQARLDASQTFCLARTTPEDLQEFEYFYEATSGGLIIEALHLAGRPADFEDLADAYAGLDMTRSRHMYSIRSRHRLHAIIMLNLTDVGLNMSDLTNSFSVFVIDQEFPADYLMFVLNALGIKFRQQNLPVLIFPQDYAVKAGLPTKKIYNLWSLSMEAFDEYLGFCHRLLKRMK